MIPASRVLSDVWDAVHCSNQAAPSIPASPEPLPDPFAAARIKAARAAEAASHSKHGAGQPCSSQAAALAAQQQRQRQQQAQLRQQQLYLRQLQSMTAWQHALKSISSIHFMAHLAKQADLGAEGGSSRGHLGATMPSDWVVCQGIATIDHGLR